MKLARVSGERQLQRWSDTDTEHTSPTHSSSTQSIRQLSASAGISFVVANIFFPLLNLFQLWRNEISNLEEGPSLSTSAFGE